MSTHDKEDADIDMLKLAIDLIENPVDPNTHLPSTPKLDHIKRIAFAQADQNLQSQQPPTAVSVSDLLEQLATGPLRLTRSALQRIDEALSIPLYNLPGVATAHRKGLTEAIVDSDELKQLQKRTAWMLKNITDIDKGFTLAFHPIVEGAEPPEVCISQGGKPQQPEATMLDESGDYFARFVGHLPNEAEIELSVDDQGNWLIQLPSSHR